MEDKQEIYSKAALDALNVGDMQGMKKNLDILGLLKKPNFIKTTFTKFKLLWDHLSEGIKEENKNLLNDLMVTAIYYKNLEAVEYLVKSNELLVKPDLENAYTWSAIFREGNLDALKLLINNSEIKNKGQVVSKGLNAINESNVEMLEFLFDSSQPHYSEFIKDFRDYNRPNGRLTVFNPFVTACSNNSKSIVNFYLSKDEIKPFINHRTFRKGVHHAASSDASLEVLDYLLTDKNMPFKMYEHYNPDILFYMATISRAEKVLRYLISDLNIKLREDINTLLALDEKKENTIFNYYPEIGRVQKLYPGEFLKSAEMAKSLFAKRELKESLDNSLNNDAQAPVSSKRRKI